MGTWISLGIRGSGAISKLTERRSVNRFSCFALVKEGVRRTIKSKAEKEGGGEGEEGRYDEVEEIFAARGIALIEDFQELVIGLEERRLNEYQGKQSSPPPEGNDNAVQMNETQN